MSWVAPTDVGGSPLTGFDVQKLNTTAGGPEWVSAGSVGDTATSFVATGLTTSASWAFRVRAVNAVGDGDVGAGRCGPYVPPTVPGAATGVAGMLGDKSVEVSWTAPASDGGSPIRTRCGCSWVTHGRSPRHRSRPARHECGGAGTDQWDWVSLRCGGHQRPGDGPVSVKSDVVTPVGPPAVPTGVAAVAGPGAGEATVSWVAPTDVGGSPLTGFDGAEA